MKTAAIYARVSSDRQKEDQTIGSQIMALEEYAQENGYTVPSEWIFQDEGYSGSLLVRPGLERLRDLVVEGQVETILIYSPDRLSRKYAYQVLLMEEFAKHGTEVLFIKSPKATTPEEELLLQFQGMIAEYERAQIAERHRRGKRYRAKTGLINVLCAAPYGYRYIKKSETSSAFYEIIEGEAPIVREMYRLYTEEMLSIGAIVRWLNGSDIPTRKKKSRWERTTVWAMLRNPAYKGKACFGKTGRVERKKITRRLRLRGGFSPRCTVSRERPREEWIEIPVPPIVTEEAFAVAQERLKKNKIFALRHTKEPTLLQGILVCSSCGYAYYRVSAWTSGRKIYYYRCLGSDNHRYTNGRICPSQPVRQDYLDALVWQHIIQLLENPDLIRAEIDRRVREVQESNPTKIRKETLLKQITRVQKGIDHLLDAYQESLLPLEELRKRIPELRKRETALKSELQTLEAKAMDQEKYRELAWNLEEFLVRLRESAENLDVISRQKILRLLVKEILVGPDTLTIKHSVSTYASGTLEGHEAPSYRLCKGSKGNITALNKAYGTNFNNFNQVPYPEDVLRSSERLVDWDLFIREVSPKYVSVIGPEPLWRDFLKDKYSNDISVLNQAHEASYESFDKIPMPTKEIDYADMLKNSHTLRWEYATRNYKMVIQYLILHGRGISNTFVFCALSILIALIVNPLAAYAMSRFNLPSTYKILLFLIATMAFPPMVTTIPNFLLFKQLGLLNTFWALVLPGMVNGYMIFLLKGFFDSLPRELYESAMIEGANEWVLFWNITMTLSKPILAVISLGAFTAAYGSFMFAFIVCQDQKMWTLMVWLYQLQQNSHQAVTFAALIIAAIPTFLVFVFCQKIIMQGIMVPVEK